MIINMTDAGEKTRGESLAHNNKERETKLIEKASLSEHDNG